MVKTESRILKARVMHKRLLPKVNYFDYGSYYLALNLQELPLLRHILPMNRRALLSFHDCDHGFRDTRTPASWAEEILRAEKISDIDTITLLCMPRVLGYVFNPVSFYPCRDKAGKLRAVICEVNNTFGDTHAYLCAHKDRREIAETDVMKAEKLMHVSPFLKRCGHYEFRFRLTDEACHIKIDYFNDAGEKLLVTSVKGHFSPLNRRNLRRIFWQYPLLTWKVICLIHFQAIKLLTKGIRYIKKPKALDKKYSRADKN